MKNNLFVPLFILQTLGLILVGIGLICLLFGVGGLSNINNLVDSPDSGFYLIENNISQAQTSLSGLQSGSDVTQVQNSLSQAQLSAQDVKIAISSSAQTSVSSLQFGIFSLILGIIFIGISLVSGLVLKGSVDDTLQKKYREGQADGREKGIWEVIDSLDKGESALSAIYLWLYKYQYGKSTTAESAKILNQITDRLKDKFGLSPIGDLGKIVKFDDNLYRSNYRNIPAGQEMRIVEVGWKYKDKFIRKPLVEKV